MNACVDPRFSLVSRGCAPWAEWLGAADNPSGAGWAVPGKGYGEKVVQLLEQVMAQEVPQSPAEPPADPLAEYPQWQREGLAALQEAGVIGDPSYWVDRFGKQAAVGELLGLLGKLVRGSTE